MIGRHVLARTAPLALAFIALAAPDAAAQEVVVEVREAMTGRPVRDARLDFVDAPSTSGIALTTPEGRGTFRRVPSGVWALRVTTLGYEERELPVEVLPDATTFVHVELTAAPITLDSLYVATASTPSSSMWASTSARRATEGFTTIPNRSNGSREASASPRSSAT